MMTPEVLAARKRAAGGPRRATLADAPKVSRTLARAFAADPVMDYFIRDDARRPQAFDTWFDFAVKRLGLPGGETWMADDDTVSAAALWLPPPQDAMNLSFMQEVRALPVFLSVVGLARVGRMQRLRAAFDAHHPKDPHWYLFFVGVDPDCQGMGLGSAILAANLKPIDAARACAYLEASTERNVTLYQRHGFEVVNEFRPEPTGPRIWGMWRKPRV